MRQRRQTVEHPFGTMKARMSEMALSVLAYNLTRVMNLVGVQPLITAIAA
jgi:transposase